MFNFYALKLGLIVKCVFSTLTSSTKLTAFSISHQSSLKESSTNETWNDQFGSHRKERKINNYKIFLTTSSLERRKRKEKKHKKRNERNKTKEMKQIWKEIQEVEKK